MTIKNVYSVWNSSNFINIGVVKIILLCGHLILHKSMIKNFAFFRKGYRNKLRIS